MKLHFAASLLALPLLAGALPAHAQDYDRPPPGYGDDRSQADDRGQGYDRGQAQGDAQDPAGLEVRVGKLEGRIREMTGQIEELQFANRQLVQQLQKFQQDVDSRLSSGGGRGKRAEANSPPATVAPDAVAEGEPAKPMRKGRHDDAYDPDSAPSSDSGRPKPLGSTASIEESGANAPMDLSGGKLRGGAPADTIAPTLRLPSSPKTAGGTLAPNGAVVASIAPNSPRAEFDAALGLYKGQQYEDAEKGFAAFIQKNPKSRLAADATYFLGESYAQRGLSSEAVEQYMKVVKDYGNSSRAPDALLHIGMSVRSMGPKYKEQACAAFTEVGRKYPNAPSYVKTGVERESKRAQC